MQAVGITAEYNPFHLGHQRLIHEIRSVYGKSVPILAVMSGNFVQRGDAAVVDKMCRTEMALRGGVNLVLELPVCWATQSAEGFAEGSMQIMRRSGVVSCIAFGSECGSCEQIERTAQALATEPYETALRAAVREGIPFAAARQRAAESLLGNTAKILREPNNSLAVEYRRALLKQSSEIDMFTVKREGGGHSGLLSSGAIRQALREGRIQEGVLPGASEALLRRERERGRAPAGLENAEQSVLYRLKTMTEQDFLDVPDCAEGLEHKMLAAADAMSLEEFRARVKSKRYSMSRINRMILHAWLGMRKQDLPKRVPYLRVLGLDETGRDLLREMKRKADLPILTRPAQIYRFNEEAQRVFRWEVLATRLWPLCLSKPSCAPEDNEFRRKPVVLQER